MPASAGSEHGAAIRIAKGEIMRTSSLGTWGRRLLAIGAAAVLPAQAGGGYFVLGYGPEAAQSAGTSTAIGLDAFAGASNPAKLSAVGLRRDLGLLVFSPNRRIEREGSADPNFDLSSTSKNKLFLLPEFGYAARINEALSWGISLYGNGGLNTDYRAESPVPGSNAAPARCGNQPGNFFLGCGQLGFDLSQLIMATPLSWRYAPGQSIGIAPLLAYQRFKAYGLQAFEGLSAHPDAVTNNGYEGAFGAGVRIGWYGQLLPWLHLGAAYSTRVYMQNFESYRGLLAGNGSFDIPENLSLGLAVMPIPKLTMGFDWQRIHFGQIKALGNGVLNSLTDPAANPLGSSTGSGFNWRNQTNYRLALAYAALPTLTLRAGFAYGERPQRDASVNSASFNLMTPNPVRNVTGGFTWTFATGHDLQFAYGRYLKGTYGGPSATALGGYESVTPYVNTFYLGWSRRY